MSSVDVASAVPGSERETIDLRLEVVVIRVSNVDRAKEFYQSLGFRLDADIARGDDFRIVQLTPPGSSASIQFGVGIAPVAPEGAASLYMVVSDLEAARAELIRRGADVSEVFHRDGAARVPGPDPQGRSYLSFASFSDPDGNGWLIQEIRERLPGR